MTTTYATAIHHALSYLLEKHDDVFILGQGVWSPWYVGSTMTDLEKRFGTDRVIDTPVSEAATTGAGVGAALMGYRPVVVHPRVDFAVLAIDQMVNQAAKWSSMFGGTATVPVTFRCIINRGGEQGAQHSQSLLSWFAHVPGLRVVVPGTPADARDLLIASVLSPDPVIFIDDRWLYDEEEELTEITEFDLNDVVPVERAVGDDLTLVGIGYATRLARDVAAELERRGLGASVIDLRVANPLDLGVVVSSVQHTGRLCVIDGDWASCGLSAEVIAQVAERLPSTAWKAPPTRVTLPPAPAPTSRALEDLYYPTVDSVLATVERLTSDS